MNSDRHSVLMAWIAAVLWLVVIAIESTALLSAANTSRFLFPLLHFLFGMDWARFEYWHFYIRKSGHVVGYATLSILLFRAWRATLLDMSGARWKLNWAAIAVLGTALVASLDEWHQSFLPSRTGRWEDAVLDICAGIAAQVLIVGWWRWRMENRSKSSSIEQA